MTLEQTPQEAPEIINLLRLRGAAGDYYLYCRPHEGRGMVGAIHVVEG